MMRPLGRKERRALARVQAKQRRRTPLPDDRVVPALGVATTLGAKRYVFNDALTRQLAAFHEAGHTLVAKLLPGTDPVHKVTIIPRGLALGLTQQLPIDDRHTYPKEYLLNNLSIMMGGRVAEEVIYGDDRITTGAGNDLQKASELARDMVVNQGMGKKLRDQVFHVDEGMMLDRIMHERQYSDETAKVIDADVREVASVVKSASGRGVPARRPAMRRACPTA